MTQNAARFGTGMVVATLLGFGLIGAGPASAEAMPAASSTCKKIRADYPGGVAKTARAQRKIVKRGFKKPIVCPRVYNEVARLLDKNRNKVVCESR